jgi:flagellar hook-associated protein 3 FlgL
MIGRLDPSSEKFLADLGRLQARQERAQRQISSGLRVAQPSDAPGEVSGILQLRAELALLLQIKTNLGRAKLEAATAEQAVQASIQVIERATVLASQGLGSLADAEKRKVIANEVAGLHDQLLNLSGANIEGRFIFSGDADGQPPFEVDPQGSAGIRRTIPEASQSTRQIQHPSGSTFGISRTAAELWDPLDEEGNPAAQNAFAALHALRSALEGNDEEAIRTALTYLGEAANHLNFQLSFYGNAQIRIEEGLKSADRMQLRLKEDLSNRQDADLVDAITELNQARIHQEAALSARAKMPRSSLFDYLG